ncbi:hypothetical protein [Clostridium cochlearium]|nr:hypothetical protein [Clostridium cochlearium]
MKELLALLENYIILRENSIILLPVLCKVVGDYPKDYVPEEG